MTRELLELANRSFSKLRLNTMMPSERWAAATLERDLDVEMV
jgi:hypothetical protein